MEGVNMNIFLTHYKRRDGSIYKDLGYLDHDKRIEYLKDCINRACEPLKYDAYKFHFQLKAIKYYQRLIKYCEKNKHIKAM